MVSLTGCDIGWIIVGGFRRAKETTNPTKGKHMISKRYDSELFALINSCAAAWQEGHKLDAEAAKMRGDAAAAVRARSRKLLDRACDLEVEIVEAEVRTLDGLIAKIRAIRAAEFKDITPILATLLTDAERIAAAR
jgi:hypothetical protein